MRLANTLVTLTLQKYKVPMWVKPYIMDYIKKNPASMVKFATSFIDVKRRKGEITKKYVRLPNGLTFKMDSVIELLNIFFYGAEGMALMERRWAADVSDNRPEYIRFYSEISELDFKHAKAIKNLIEGLGYKLEERRREIALVFDYVGSIEPWEDRVLATGIVLKHSYVRAFGDIFYRVFYHVAPEFMRSFGKSFSVKTERSEWSTSEAVRMLRDGSIDRGHAIELTREILARVHGSINSDMRLARKLGVVNEVRLLNDIAIAYPFEKLSEIGLDVDVQKEVRLVKKSASSRNYKPAQKHIVRQPRGNR